MRNERYREGFGKDGRVIGCGEGGGEEENFEEGDVVGFGWGEVCTEVCSNGKEGGGRGGVNGEGSVGR